MSQAACAFWTLEFLGNLLGPLVPWKVRDSSGKVAIMVCISSKMSEDSESQFQVKTKAENVFTNDTAMSRKAGGASVEKRKFYRCRKEAGREGWREQKSQHLSRMQE